MTRSIPLLVTLFLGLVAAQTPGKGRELHPRLTTWECTHRHGCRKKQTSVVLDSLSHPVYQKNAPDFDCGGWGQTPNATACPDDKTCVQNCIMDPVSDYSDYGVTTCGGDLHMEMINDDGKVVSPRVYLLSENKNKYEMMHLTGKEFTFDVDMSNLPCGMNGALYLSEMEKDGGKKKEKLNKGGAYYGTGYCDAQCYTTPFVNGAPNLAGVGACCNELDIWEANSRSTHLAPHVCNKPGLYGCTGEECGREAEGVCDKNGCGFNPYRVENKDYYGLGLQVDTSRPFTVVTQFPADRRGNLQSIVRLYIQDGKVIQNAEILSDLGLPEGQNFLDDDFCAAVNSEQYMALGATKGMGKSLDRGMVLAFAIWWDEDGFMHWLDSEEAGPCNATEGNPEVVLEVNPRPKLTFGQIKWGEIGSTFKARK
ncbi:hypothetical protein AJ80_09384 [Polytolypa hystricis UAMH7299]|uniref:Glucanase n=1 Tax=Polytolypa hystricis (strain UAMH7299) TaxID=1447883 RepID=A0A2B7WRX6_POLH7|nr:hypothetical protein AJ80_09384 [Polytolypa hystricis UAMH7299]